MSPHVRYLPNDFAKLGSSDAQYDVWYDEVVDHLTMQGLRSYVDGVNVTWPPRGTKSIKSSAKATSSVAASITETVPGADESDTETEKHEEEPSLSSRLQPVETITFKIPYGGAQSPEEWQENRNVVCAVIRSSITIEVRGTLPDSTKNDPVKLVAELRKVYRKDTAMARVIRLKTLLTSRKGEDVNWDEHINKLTKLANQALDKHLSLNELISIAIILSCPPDWDTTINSCMQSCKLEEPSAFRVQLTAEEARRQDAAQTQADVQALAAARTHQQSHQQSAQSSKKGKNPKKAAASIPEDQHCSHVICNNRNVQQTHRTKDCNRLKSELGGNSSGATSNSKQSKAALKASNDDDGNDSSSTMSLIAVATPAP
ncbi:hypothetical protein EXIGLDRAFT_769074, partial [Exidia glandulosa HHB12029]